MTDDRAPIAGRILQQPAAATAEPARAPRYGVADLGSNGIRLQIVELQREAGAAPVPRVLFAAREPVRLGQEVFATGTIPEDAAAAAIDAMRRFRSTCDEQGVLHVRAIATSAMREAANRDQILERIRTAAGIDVEVISGSQEAYLLGLAVGRVIDLRSGRSLLIDIGGGSCEVTVYEHGHVASADSYRLGSLRILQALAGSGTDDHGRAFLELLEQYVRSLEGRIENGIGSGRIRRFVATGGSIESLADLIAGDRRDGKEIACRLADVQDWARRLALQTRAERIAQYGLKPDRADTILPAAVVCYRLGRLAGADEVLVPRVGLKDGLVQELLAGHLDTFHAADQRETVLASCRALGRKYAYDEAHALHVQQLAIALFEQTRAVHRLGPDERILLEAAALLHDIGVFVSNSKHHKHSWYLIRSSDLVGLSADEQELVALIARFHRRAHPGREQPEYQVLPRAERRTVDKLAAILRVADALDREHLGKIADVAVTATGGAIELQPVFAPGAERNIALEAWSVEQKSGLWREVFGLPLRLIR
jgi:exopolyphosphatase/guanosine-5'-triphosphate,3'-diphosphate pyrophosphatase